MKALCTQIAASILFLAMMVLPGFFAVVVIKACCRIEMKKWLVRYESSKEDQ